MSYLTMTEQKARRKKVRQRVLLSLGIVGLALLLLPFHDRFQTRQPYQRTYWPPMGGESKDDSRLCVPKG